MAFDHNVGKQKQHEAARSRTKPHEAARSRTKPHEAARSHKNENADNTAKGEIY